MSRAANGAESGFTLIEALVAMAVLALGAVSLLSAAEQHTARINEVTGRAAARWAAQTRLSELSLGLEWGEARAEVIGRAIRLTQTVRATEDAALRAVRVEAAHGGRRLFVLDGYVLLPEAD